MMFPLFARSGVGYQFQEQDEAHDLWRISICWLVFFSLSLQVRCIKAYVFMFGILNVPSVGSMIHVLTPGK